MGRYTTRERVREERPWTIHPIWRGIGIIWLILVPVLSYVLAKIFNQMNIQYGLLPVTPELSRQIVFAPYVFPSGVTFDPMTIVNLFPWGPHYYIELLFWAAFAFLGFGIMSIVYSFLYRTFGPPRSVYETIKDEPRRRRR